MISASRLTWMFPAIDTSLQVAWPPSYPAHQDPDAQLRAAAAEGNEQTLRQILVQGTDPNAMDFHGRTALFHAALQGHIESVRILLEFEASVYPRDQAGLTPLLSAMRHGHWEVADVLLQAESYSMASGAYAMNSFMWGAQAGNADLIGFLAPYEARLHGANIDSRLFDAVDQGNARAVRALLQAGAHVDFRTHDGATMLMVASGRGDTAVMTSLVLEGAEIDAVDMMGRTALMYAVASGNADTVRELLRSEPQVNARTHHGATALLLAADMGNADMISLLRRDGADMHATDNDGMSAMLLAAAHQHLEVIGYLRAQGADIDAHLLTAVQRGTLAMVQTLISAGADVDAATGDGRTAMALARERGHPGIIECLEWTEACEGAAAGAGSVIAAEDAMVAAGAASAAHDLHLALPSLLHAAEPAASIGTLGATDLAQPHATGIEHLQAVLT